MGGASRWWLHQALESLNLSLQGKLNIFSGDPLTYSAATGPTELS